MRLALLALCACALDPMAAQEKPQPYAPSEIFADGLAMRAPPPGTVPRERTLGPPELLRGRRPDGTYVDAVPLLLTRSALETGRARFEIFCAACHGLLGDGRSPVAGNMSLRPPPSLVEHAHHPAGFYFEVISSGFGLMPSYAAEIPLRERWSVVAYLRALQLSQSAPLALAPPDVRARLEAER